MSGNSVISVRIRDIPVISIWCDPGHHSSLLSSTDILNSQIPALSIVIQTENRDSFWKIRILDSAIPVLKKTDIDGTIVLEGRTELLTSEDWTHLILTLTSKALQYKKLYQIDASGILSGDQIILFSAIQGDGKSAVAYYLSKLGYPVISTQTCLIDENMNLWAGTRNFGIRDYYRLKYFPDLHKDHSFNSFFALSHVSRDYSAQKIPADFNLPDKINRIYHLHLQNSVGSCNEILKFKDRLLLSSNVISRHICRHTVMGSWGLILPQTDDDSSLQWRTTAIQSMAGLKHFSLHCPLHQIEQFIMENAHGQS